MGATGLAMVFGEWQNVSESDIAPAVEILSAHRDMRMAMGMRAQAAVGRLGAQRLVDKLQKE